MPHNLLADLRILDLTFWLPGPTCSLVLADLGAEVIKIERRLMGDPVRLSEPAANGASAHFLALHRNKRSLALNLKRPQGREILCRLAATADVVLEGFKPGQAESMGIGYRQLAPANPKLVYCALSGYGQDGSRASRAGHDLNYAALAGLFEAITLENRPVLPGLQLADLAGALYAATGILAALVRRGVTGKGAYLDVNMLAATVNLLNMPASTLLAGQGDANSSRYLGGYLPCYNLYQTRDGRWMALGALEPVFWGAFCRAVGHEEWIGRQFPPPAERDRLLAELQLLFAGRTQTEWVTFLADKDLCCEPVLSLQEALAQPDLAQQGMLFFVDHPQAGQVGQVGTPIRVDGAAAANGQDRAAPLLGEHTAAILGELGYRPGEIALLVEKKVIACRGDGI